MKPPYWSTFLLFPLVFVGYERYCMYLLSKKALYFSMYISAGRVLSPVNTNSSTVCYKLLFHIFRINITHRGHRHGDLFAHIFKLSE